MKNEETNRSPDDAGFEHRLRQQPLKQIPATWRNEIIAAARDASKETHASRTTRHVPRFTFQTILQRIIWPHPKGWLALGASWLVIAVLNISSRETGRTAPARESAPSVAEAHELAQQKLLFAELIGQATADAELPKVKSPRPHSWRRDEFFVL